ncbi:hypothetical protein DBW_0201 [Desulfuromonas sp. DDH964]|uniref:Spy/CpxP family protein refolding chaperone n=1 Tax=Desulfuromonas sp. DDH964 TaxID=1823759 RepID=UPI00078BA8D9|nr:hypothetical protein [Desulfuromonas sp. DDH964]AMV70601.1 hypothetical protein DBW_0201 [Desulfuromonas sp. DDH964]
MKRVLFTAVLISVYIGTTVISSLAASEHEAHHPAGAQSAATTSKQGKMNPQGMAQMPCMAAADAGSMSQMMGMMGEGMGDMMDAGMGKMMSAGKMGMMEQRMAHMFYLDRVDELGLSADQVSKLKTLHMDCRKDNIRNAAEAKIARLDLADLLSGDNWTLKDAEALVRKIQKLEGDIQVRHLQAISDAHKVLTNEQLKQARSGEASGNLESLFQ